MDAPDYETRLAIVKRRAGERGVPVDPAVLEVVASIPAHNVRELLGLLNRIVAYQAVSEVPLTPEAAHQLLAGEAPALRPGAPSAAAPPPPSDEFTDFLSGITQAVHEQVGVWRSRITESIKRWGGEGYRTARLEQLLKQEVPTGIERVIREYERDVDRLRGFQRAMARVDPHRVSDPIFYDPDRLDEADGLVQAALREGRPPPGPSPAWTLDTLVPGESNELVLSAANAVIASPGAVYNPLVIVGRGGVGKTHLLHGIGNQLAGGASARVACLSAQEFVDELLDAIDGDRVEGWRKRYRGATALLLDDVHLLAGKERSQEELFNLYNTLLADQRQMVFTLIAAPKEIDGLDPRLVSRLDGGLVAELGEPDLELREGIVARRLRNKHPDADSALIAYLAARRADSVRTVINTVQRFLRAVQAENVEPTLAFAQALLEGAALSQRPSAAVRTSGLIPTLGAGVRSREKVVWEWPDPEQRVIEELV
jgi:chromosomal replication initiator protein